MSSNRKALGCHFKILLKSSDSVNVIFIDGLWKMHICCMIFFFLYRLFALQNNVSVMWCIFDKQLLTGDL